MKKKLVVCNIFEVIIFPDYNLVDSRLQYRNAFPWLNLNFDY